MKKSTRYLIATFITMVLLEVTMVTASQLENSRMMVKLDDIFELYNATQDKLDTMKDFDNVIVYGPLRVTVKRQDDYSIKYVPPAGEQSGLAVRSFRHQIVLNGHASDDPDAVGSLEIGLPNLTYVAGDSVKEITVEGFTQGKVVMSFGRAKKVMLRNNEAPTEVMLYGVKQLQWDAVSAARAELSVTNVSGEGALQIKPLPPQDQ